MINRRSVLISGIACSFAVALFQPATTFADDDVFVCSTDEPDPTSADLSEIDDFASSEGSTIEELTATLKSEGLTPFGTGMVKDVWRKKDGLTPGTGVITLGVYFADGSDAQKAAVVTHASKWLAGDLGKIVAFEFDVPQAQAQIAITFNTSGNSSKIGRASRDVARSGITMHLAQQTERAICHEFGHALGLRHEQSNADFPVVWNKPAVYADMAKQGWDQAKVDGNVFAKFGKEAKCLGDPDPNLKSIMLYPIPPGWTQNELVIPLNTKIDERDRKCLISLYRA